RPNHAGWTALDPAGHIFARDRLLRLGVQHSAMRIEDHAPSLLERHAGQLGPSVTDGTKDQPGAKLFGDARRLGRDGARFRTHQSIADEAHAPDVTVAVVLQLHRRDKEAQVEPTQSADRLPRGKRLQQFNFAFECAVVSIRHGLLAYLIEHHLRGLYDD